MSRQSISILALSVIAAAAMPARRFVTGAGALCGAGGAGLGVLEEAAELGDIVGVTVLGTAVIESGGAFAKDAPLQSDAIGRAVTAGSGPVLARALEAATAAGQQVEVLVCAAAAHDKLAHVAASNDVTRYNAAGALAVSGIALVEGGNGLAGLTLAAPRPGCRCELRIDSLAAGTVVVTAAAGVTFDGINNTATFNAAGDALVLGYKSATQWEVVQNVGAVALSAV